MSTARLLTTAVAGFALYSAAPAHASFVGVFHENLNAGNNSLFIFGTAGTMGNIAANDGLDIDFTIDGTGVFTQNFGSRGREMTTDGTVNTLSYSVTSANPISGLALNRGPNSTDMTTLLDLDGLGTSYRVLTTPGTFGNGSQMSVTAVEDDTVVTINPSIALSGNVAGTPFMVTLQKGESVFYESGTNRDLSGTSVSANKRVAVFGGAECAQVPNGIVACDHLISQQFSTDNFDTQFRIAKNFGGGTGNDLVRVIADTDGTEIFLNGVSQGTIDAGGVLTIDGVGNGVLTSTKPVMVGQFTRGTGGTRALGDPAFAIIPSVDQELQSYAYATPIGGDAFDQNFLNIAIDSAISGSLILNGAAVDTSGFEAVGGFLFGNLPIDVGFGVIEASASFLATISGFAFADSYFSVVATAFSPGVSPPPPPPSAVPLPASVLLLAAGIGGLGAMRRRRARTDG